MDGNNKRKHHGNSSSDGGNILFIILIAIVLIGALTAALQQGNNSDSAQIDDETLAIRASEVQQNASEMERAILYIQQNGVSESDIRFAHPDPSVSTDYGDITSGNDKSYQVFHRDGGGANYPDIPTGVQTGAGGQWEFFGGTHLPGVGSSRADLIAVLPNVTKAFCDRINALNDQTSSQPVDDGDCLKQDDGDRYGNGGDFASSPNTVDEDSFTNKPAMQACVQCTGVSGQPYHLYHVLLPR